MSSWQYAQLTITVDGRASRAGARTMVWHGPGQGVGENYSDSEQTVLELLNRFGADGGASGLPRGRGRVLVLGGVPAAHDLHVQASSPCLRAQFRPEKL